MELIGDTLSHELQLFSEYLQRVGGELFKEAFRVHQIRDLSVQQLRYLEVIEASDGVTPMELSRLFAVRKPTVSNLVGQLESKGLIHRERDGTDRRINRLYATGVTRSIFDRRRGMYRELAEHIKDRLTDEEVVKLVELFRKATDGLEEHGE